MYVLHATPDSAGLAVHLTLLELGQPFRIAEVTDETRHLPAYRALQPLGLVPALETADGPMFETAAILLWLADRHGALAPTPDAPERAAFLKWFFFTSFNLHSTVMMLFYPDRYTGDAAANPTFQRTNAVRMAGYLAQIEAVAASRPTWLDPHAPSILGYYISMLLRWCGSFQPGDAGYVDLAAFPALMAMARALEDRPAAHAAARAEGLGTTIFSAPAV